MCKRIFEFRGSEKLKKAIQNYTARELHNICSSHCCIMAGLEFSFEE
jgi:hypothetical protein